MANGYLTQYLMVSIMAIENTLDKQCLPKTVFFPIRGMYWIYLIVNLVLGWILYTYGWTSTPSLMRTAINVCVVMKLIYTISLVF